MTHELLTAARDACADLPMPPGTTLTIEDGAAKGINRLLLSVERDIPDYLLGKVVAIDWDQVTVEKVHEWAVFLLAEISLADSSEQWTGQCC